MSEDVIERILRGGRPVAQESAAGATAAAEGRKTKTTDGILAPPKIESKGLDALPLVFSHFPNVQAKTIQQDPVTWADVRAKLIAASREYPNKSGCPLFKLATFGDVRTEKGSLRSDGNLDQVYGVEGDYDGEKISVDQAADLLARAGIEAFIYTSPSHSDSAPRWRVVAPLSMAHSKDERRAFVGVLNEALGGILSAESFTASQSYYYGRVKCVPFHYRHIAGSPLDDVALTMDECYPEKEATTCQVRNLEDIERQFTLETITQDTIQTLRAAISALNPQRAAVRESWVKIGHAIKSIEQGGFAEEALDLWLQFSALDPAAYDEEGALLTWENLNPNDITYKTIFKHADDDSPGWRDTPSTPKTTDQYATREDHTDTGNANLLWRLTDGDLRFVPDRRLWLWWDGGRWIADVHGSLAHQAALRVARHYHNKAAELAQKASDPAHDDDGRKKIEKAIDALRKWEKQCRNKRTIDSMLATAAKDTRFHVSPGELDRDPWLLGVENGVVDLRTGALRPAARDEFVTKRSPVRFDPAAKAPRWLQFIEEITGAPSASGDFTRRENLAGYLHRALGYSLTGSVAEQKMFVCIGAGSNGKNVLLDIFQWVAGDYCQTIPPEALMATRHDNDAERPSPTAASLAGARAAISSESKDGQRLDVALVKRHTGGGYMTARLMRENTFRFEITHKLWLMTNHRPALDHLDDAMRGRLHLIPFDRRWNRPGHPERDPALPDGDKDLMTKLRAEAEGVLAWLVAGAVAYSTDDIEPPLEVARMTRDYFNDQDALGKWLEGFETCTPKDGELAGDLFNAFREWCADEGMDDPHPKTQTAFSLALRGRGVEKASTKNGKRYGLRVYATADSVTGYGL